MVYDLFSQTWVPFTAIGLSFVTLIVLGIVMYKIQQKDIKRQGEYLAECLDNERRQAQTLNDYQRRHLDEVTVPALDKLTQAIERGRSFPKDQVNTFLKSLIVLAIPGSNGLDMVTAKIHAYNRESTRKNPGKEIHMELRCKRTNDSITFILDWDGLKESCIHIEII